MPISCCKNCVAPKRHLGCHSTCPEYLSEKAAHDEMMAAYAKEAKIDSAIIKQRNNAIRKARKKRRR